MIPLARPVLGEEEAAAARRVILSGWAMQGPEVAAFEREFASFVGARHAVAVANCTVALFLALRVVGVKPGDEVVTVSHSFIATANAVRHVGATPVFVDIEPETYNIDAKLVDAAVGPQTKAFLIVHQLGMPADMTALLAVAQRHGLPLIEDAACAIGSEIQVGADWQSIGRPHGDLACFSFHPRKLLTTGDGGMVTTTNEAWARQLRLWRSHSMGSPASSPDQAGKVHVESFEDLGYNFRLSDIQAAIGRQQLLRIPDIITERRALVSRYRTLLGDAVHVPVEPAWARTNWQSLCIRLPQGTDQRRLMQGLLDDGVATRSGVMCAHREPAYRDGSWRGGSLLESERAQDGCLTIPLYNGMAEEDQVRVADALRRAVARQPNVTVA